MNSRFPSVEALALYGLSMKKIGGWMSEIHYIEQEPEPIRF